MYYIINILIYIKTLNILHCQISWKTVHRNLSCFIRTDRQTDGQPYRQTGRHDKVAFWNFAKVPKMESVS